MTILNEYHHSLIIIIIVSTFDIRRYALHDLKKISFKYDVGSKVH